MYRKIYGTDAAELSTVINVGGTPMRIEFTGGVPFGVSRVSARYATTNKAIQDAIESDSRYGTLFHLETMTPVQTAEKVVTNGKVKEYNYITRVQDAINVLVVKHGVALDTLKNKKDVRDAAKKNNISFPNLK